MSPNKPFPFDVLVLLCVFMFGLGFFLKKQTQNHLLPSGIRNKRELTRHVKPEPPHAVPSHGAARALPRAGNAPAQGIPDPLLLFLMSPDRNVHQQATGKAPVRRVRG